MRLLAVVLAVLTLLFLTASSAAGERVHVVAKGHTLGAIAKRYRVTVAAICAENDISRNEPIRPGQKLVIPSREQAKRSSKVRYFTVAKGHTLGAIARRFKTTIAAICHANEIQRSDPIRPGQRLVIPAPDDEDGSQARRARARETAQRERTEPSTRELSPDGMRVLRVPGVGAAYYYAPVGPGRLTMRPVLMYMHGRGNDPKRDCRRWQDVARRLGWVVCPLGEWNNSWHQAHRLAVETVKALREKYPGRVQLYGNTIMGFSEGAYVAMNVGVRNPRMFNRWLILGGDTAYWGEPGKQALGRARSSVRRVYLITGEKDGVVTGTRRLRQWLRQVGVPTRITTPDDMGHALALDRKKELYRMALVWLARG